MRLFTAIPLPPEIKSKVAAITRGRLPVPYVNTTNLHITLNFFGELDTDQSEKAKSVFPKACTGLSPFAIEFDKIAAHHNRQIHMTVRKSAALMNLQSELESAFRAEGFIFQARPYYPHVKLANMHLDNVMNRERKIEHFPNSELSELNFEAGSIILYESKLLLHHAQHIPRMEISLRKK